jgi:hypothetical protein
MTDPLAHDLLGLKELHHLLEALVDTHLALLVVACLLEVELATAQQDAAVP